MTGSDREAKRVVPPALACGTEYGRDKLDPLEKMARRQVWGGGSGKVRHEERGLQRAQQMGPQRDK